MSTSHVKHASFDSADSQRVQSIVAPVAAIIFTLLAGWVFVHRPAQQQVAALEQQCHKLTQVVEKLAGDSSSLDRSNNLLELLNRQAAGIESAERSLARLDSFHAKLSRRLDDVEQLSRSMDCLAEVETVLIREQESLTGVLQALQNLERTHQGIVDSGSVADDIRSTLYVLDDLHLELEAQRQEALAATKVANHLRQLCDGLVAAGPQASAAAGVAEQWAITQNKLVHQRPKAQAAQLAATELLEDLSGINQTLATQGLDVARSKRNLTRMVAIQQQLQDQQGSIAESAAVMQDLQALESVVGRASSTIDTIQRMVVDICLVQPADAQSLATQVTQSRQQQAPVAGPRTAEAVDADSTSNPHAWNTVYHALRCITPLYITR